RDHVVALVPQDVGQGVQQGLVVVGDDDLADGGDDGDGRHQAATGASEGIRAGSMFPPLITSTVGPWGCKRPDRSAAVVAAPEGSTVSPASKCNQRVASTIAVSETVTGSARPKRCWN